MSYTGFTIAFDVFMFELLCGYYYLSSKDFIAGRDKTCIANIWRSLGLFITHGNRSSETRDRSRSLSYDQRRQYRELIVQLRKETNITMASSNKEQAVWPETPAADSLEIQIANIFLDTLVMHRTLSAHRGL